MSDDPRFTKGLVIDVAKALEQHGYERPLGAPLGRPGGGALPLPPRAERAPVGASAEQGGGSIGARYRAHTESLTAGWRNIDEVREIEDLPPLPDDQGKRYLWPPRRQQLTELELALGADDESGKHDAMDQLELELQAAAASNPTPTTTTPPPQESVNP